jgi:hypothetical protein
MGIELHNFYWEQERLVQVETQPHHVAGLLANIRETLANSDAEWEDIYSAYYECPEDGTVTFYEAESAEAGRPGIWTYMVYACTAGEETVVLQADLDTYQPVLALRALAAQT